MEVAYKIKADELDSNFLESVKKLFKNKTLYISIATETEDETAYLLSNEKNAKRLLNAINNIENKKNIVYKSAQELGI